MTTYENAPPQDFWVCEPRACPIPCAYCTAANAVEVPANIVRGTE